jgi:hypothetical protein
MATTDSGDLPKGQANEGNRGKPSEPGQYNPHQGSDLAVAQALLPTGPTSTHRNDEQKSKIPEGIQKDGQNLTLEMRTPIGSDVRRQAAYSQAAKDYNAAKRVEKYFGDSNKEPLVTSRDIRDKSVMERREPTRGPLSNELSKESGFETGSKDLER